MKKIIFYSLFSLLALDTAAQKPGYQLIFEEDFTGGAYDMEGNYINVMSPSKWVRENYKKGGRGHEIFVGDSHHDFIDPGDDKVYDFEYGKLNFNMLNQGVPFSMYGGGCTVDIDLDGDNECAEDYQFISGWFETVQKFQYGYFEITCNVPEADNFFQAFWLYGQNGAGEPGPDWYNEIDIFEQVDIKNGGWTDIIGHELEGNVHYASKKIGVLTGDVLEDDIVAYSLDVPFDIKAPINYGTTANKYGLEWTPNYMIWYVNDVKTRIIKCNAYTPRHMMKLIVNWAMRNYTAENPTTGVVYDPFPPTYADAPSMEIENISVYKKLQVTDFGSSLTAGGWNNNIHRRMIADVNADGMDDIVGFGHSKVYVSLAQESTQSILQSGSNVYYQRNSFESSKSWAWDFCAAQGWDTHDQPIDLKDINNDGAADIVGFGYNGVRIAKGKTDGTTGFTTPTTVISNFGSNPSAGGWNSDYHLRLVEDINNDGRADIIGFGWSQVIVSLSTPTGFTTPIPWLTGMSYAQGWRMNKHIRLLADVDNDNDLDLVGFFDDGVYVSYNTGSSFSIPVLKKSGFGYDASAGSWRIEDHLRFCEDLDNDGYPELIGFYNDEVVICKGSPTGFGAFISWTPDFGKNDGWSTVDHERYLEDINGDGLLDIVGFNKDGVHAAVNLSGACSQSFLWRNYYGNSSEAGYFNPAVDHRTMGDYNGDGQADIITFSKNGVMASLSSNCFRPLYEGEEEIIDVHGKSAISENLDREKTSTKPNYVVSPNPSNGEFNLEFKGEISGAINLIEVHTLSGQLVYSEELPSGNLKGNYFLDTGLKVGAYILTLRTDDQVIGSERLIIAN